MTLRIVQPEAGEWDAFVEARHDGHILQTPAWGQLKARFGWQDARLGVKDGARLVAGAQVLFRHLPLQLGTLAYVPRGPLVDWDNEVLLQTLWEALDQLCRARRAVLLKIEPGVPSSGFRVPGFRLSLHAIQPPRTIVVDIRSSEEKILARMHKKTRYNVRLSARKGATVRAGEADDLEAFYALMKVTGTRDGFGVHSLDYYRAALELFASYDRARLLLAEVEGEIVAGIMVFALGQAGKGSAWYFYGASGNTHREKMPNYALQWEAMRWARRVGCVTYDLWGIPDEDEETLEAHYLERRDGLWGVYRFKRGFGGRVIRYVGAYDRVYNPLLYKLSQILLRLREYGSQAAGAFDLIYKHIKGTL